MNRDLSTRITDTEMRIAGFALGASVLLCFSLGAFGSGWAVPGWIYASITILSFLAFIIESWRYLALINRKHIDSECSRAVRVALAEGQDVPAALADAA